MPAPTGRITFPVSLIVTMIRVEWHLRRHSLPDTCRALGVDLQQQTPHGVEPAALDAADRRHIRRVMRASSRLYPRWPGGDTCLRRALAVAHMIQQQRPSIAIGVRRDSATREILAHAWVVVGGHSLDPTEAAYLSLPLGARDRAGDS